GAEGQGRGTDDVALDAVTFARVDPDAAQEVAGDDVARRLRSDVVATDHNLPRMRSLANAADADAGAVAQRAAPVDRRADQVALDDHMGPAHMDARAAQTGHQVAVGARGAADTAAFAADGNAGACAGLAGIGDGTGRVGADEVAGDDAARAAPRHADLRAGESVDDQAADGAALAAHQEGEAARGGRGRIRTQLDLQLRVRRDRIRVHRAARLGVAVDQHRTGDARQVAGHEDG